MSFKRERGPNLKIHRNNLSEMGLQMNSERKKKIVPGFFEQSQEHVLMVSVEST
jgi:hypothetical protein